MGAYLGTFIIAFATLALEITLTRILSVVTWYHLAFFAISTAMLGMTAGAVTVYLRPLWFEERKLGMNIGMACLGFALITPLALIILCLLPMEVEEKSTMGIAALLVSTLACSMPFYCSGIAVSAILTKGSLPIGKIYAMDLIGASLGCLFVLGGLELLDAPSLIIACAALGTLAALCFSWAKSSLGHKSTVFVLMVVLCVGVALNASASRSELPRFAIRLVHAKGNIIPFRNIIRERWNSFSKITVFRAGDSSPQLWGPSPITPKMSPIKQYYMNIDGSAGTIVRPFHSRADLTHLGYDVTNAVYRLRPTGGVCIIGIGGGRDIQSALFFGHEKVKALDVNPIFIDLLNEDFKDFAGLAGRKDVEMVKAEARSYLTSSKEKFAVIQMSLIDTWAATGAGAFSLSENALYTVEGWRIFLDRLAPGGIFTVSRWYDKDNLGETGRVVSLAVETLLSFGVEDPSRHIAMLTSDYVSTLLVSLNPFTQEDTNILADLQHELKFDVPITPTALPHDKRLSDIVTSRSSEELQKRISGEEINFTPPTDDSPYFFNIIKLSNLGRSFKYKRGVMKGNVTATMTLISLICSLFVLVVLTILVPLIFGTKDKNRFRALSIPGVSYFSLIGAGFMFIEIALIQRLSVFLGHPVFALGIVLFTIICTTGFGSYLSEKVSIKQTKVIFALPLVIFGLVMVLKGGMPTVMHSMESTPILIKILTSIIIIAPIGIALGFFFPVGMRLVNRVAEAETPWYWALNGIFGVLSSAIAVFVSIYFSISMNFYIGALCYALLLIPIKRLFIVNTSTL